MFYLSSESKSEEEVKDSVWYPRSKSMLQIDLIPFQNLIRELGAPPQHNPNQMVLNHRNGSVRYVTLFSRQSCIQVIFESLGELLDYDRTVSNFLAIELDEGKLSLLGAEFKLVVNILKEIELLVLLQIVIIHIQQKKGCKYLRCDYIIDFFIGFPFPVFRYNVFITCIRMPFQTNYVNLFSYFGYTIALRPL